MREKYHKKLSTRKNVLRVKLNEKRTYEVLAGHNIVLPHFLDIQHKVKMRETTIERNNVTLKNSFG